MENSSSRFFKGFSLEDYKLQVLFNTLEKEKKQYLNQLKEQTHVFKMSLRPTVKSGEEYWSQYGENYHANGDKREKDSVTHLSTELKEGRLILVLPFLIFFFLLQLVGQPCSFPTLLYGSHHHSANAMSLNLLQQTLSLKCFFVLSSVREEGADPFSRLNLCNYSGKCSSL